jgi:hypothetical protein
MGHGERDRTRQLLTARIETLAGLTDPTSANPAVAEAYGLLHVGSALNAAWARRAVDARGHLAETERIACRTGERNTLRFHLGPTNWRRLICRSRCRLEDKPAAYERATAEPINVHALGSANRVATLYFDCAGALARAHGNRDAETIRHLDTADRITPVLFATIRLPGPMRVGGVGSR